MKLAGLLSIVVFTLLLTSSLFAGNADVKITGDFRYRYEIVDKESSDEQYRHRIRGRASIKADFKNGLITVLEITSGSSDPVSNNQTLTDGFSTKELGLNLAFAEWKVSFINSMSIFMGKMKNPFYMVQKSELLWDPDLNPEGIATKYLFSKNKTSLFINSGFFLIQERKTEEDSYFAGLQAGIKQELSDYITHVRIGGGYTHYINVKGQKPFYNEDKSYGNSLDTSGNYLVDYREFDIFGEIGLMIQNWPVIFFGNFVTNTEADDHNTGWLAGVSIGDFKKPEPVSFRYQYKRQEADAVLGLYTDSDFLSGGTDGKGHEFNFNLKVTNGTTFSATLFLNKIGLIAERDYKRLQTDISFKFK